MFRPAVRALARAPVTARTPATSRLISTAPKKSRSWKSAAVRWGLAGGVVYYYNTSDVFAKEPSFSILSSLQTDNGDESLPTLDSVVPKIREERKAEKVALQGGLNQLEEEAGQQAAFNPETGEINWDCPCLGGMASGPCGEEFKAAFSCFVYSEEEPKGIECIDKFKGMQDCFRLHPDVYGAELEDDDEYEGGAPAPSEQQPTTPEDDAPKEESTGETLITKAAHGTEEKTEKAEK
ncbi:hypothetical protein N7495_000772 [Penicillium taxi]|uniref:uncharacterized protein n=1 Tax=Penicillium taxi TaxID=168475 RepID=UPI00254527F1|nr:uncharacterized protein N7495_000772 [Penicillium taxi]KAJ5908090.1 hypothetical protein N7495_000772 [Penicillium taxi]